jgi:hypothetical protein
VSDRITLVVWRDAVKDPPDHERPVWTDLGGMSYTDDHDDNTPPRRYQRLWLHGTSGTPVLRQPRVWCDPIPPTKNALTVEDVRVLSAPELFARGRASIARARLRAVLPKEGEDE